MVQVNIEPQPDSDLPQKSRSLFGRHTRCGRGSKSKLYIHHGRNASVDIISGDGWREECVISDLFRFHSGDVYLI